MEPIAMSSEFSTLDFFFGMGVAFLIVLALALEDAKDGKMHLLGDFYTCEARKMRNR